MMLLLEFLGSLKDVLENEAIQLDWNFRMSLIHDIVKVSNFIVQHAYTKSNQIVYNQFLQSFFYFILECFVYKFIRKLWQISICFVSHIFIKGVTYLVHYCRILRGCCKHVFFYCFTLFSFIG